MSAYLPPPNYTQVPNDILDNLAYFTPSQVSIVMTVCRQTFGWKKNECIMSLAFIEAATGLSRPTVCDQIDKLVEQGVLKRHPEGQGFGYSLAITDQLKNFTSKNSLLVKEIDQEVVKNFNQSDRTINTLKEKEERKVKVVAVLPEIPAHLRTPEVQNAWNEWVNNRKEIKKPLTPRAASSNFLLLRDWGPDKFIASITASIANGWQGLFEPKENRNGHSKENTPWEKGQMVIEYDRQIEEVRQKGRVRQGNIELDQLTPEAQSKIAALAKAQRELQRSLIPK